jgi:cardiolipin synthase
MDPISHFFNFPMIFNIMVYGLGLYLAINALFQSRTPQGATAWFLGLIGFPYLAIPLFIIFGRRRYHDESKEPSFDLPDTDTIQHRKDSLAEFERFLKHTGSSFTGKNTIDLLVDGELIYNTMLEEIDKAEEYILLQVYIFRTDGTGKRFAEALSRKAKAGVKVYLLYEKVLISMSEKVLQNMQSAGVNLGLFKPFKRNKWHLNFRNHRKILVVDGRVGFFGGLNIGDDYVGKYPEIGDWRDTNVKICGPALLPAQRAFAKDWLSSQGNEADIDWKSYPCEGKANVLLFSSGPVEEKPLCLLHHIALVDLATKRLWIANPYIVPPQSLMDALAMAALRGVDVRILVPKKNDNPFIVAVADIYYERLIAYGVRILSYETGFLHQKVMLIDDVLGVVGSANLDFRSMYINFEVTTVSSDQVFIQDMEDMLLKDFSNSREMSLSDFKNKSLIKKISERTVNLLAPVL